MLRGVLAEESKRINDALRAEGFPGDLLRPDATIDPEGYAGLYGREALDADTASVRNAELDFSGARNPNIQEFYREEHGARTEDEIVARWRENQDRGKSKQMEMAVTALLSRKLGKEFLVVRTAPYDDYRHGVDNLILDRVTGEVIGAFDEVHDGGGGRDTEKKKKKIQKIADSGGARIRYGLKMTDGKLERTKLEGVPVFYLGLDSSELSELVEGLGNNNAQKTDRVFEKLLASLESQRAGLERDTEEPEFRARLASFGQSLSRLTNTEERRAA